MTELQMGSSSLKRLSVPSGLITAPGRLEATCRYVPLFGWIVANELEKRRFKPVLDSLAKQLQARDSDSIASEFTEGAEVKCARCAARSIMQQFGWPNDHYLATDPLALLFFGDEGASVAVFNDIADDLGISNEVFSSQFIKSAETLTFGELVSKLLDLCRDARNID